LKKTRGGRVKKTQRHRPLVFIFVSLASVYARGEGGKKGGGKKKGKKEIKKEEKRRKRRRVKHVCLSSSFSKKREKSFARPLEATEKRGEKKGGKTWSLAAPTGEVRERKKEVEEGAKGRKNLRRPNR